MTKLEELEKVGRQAWLATIGTYAKGWEILSSKVNETFKDTNQLINEFVVNGEKIETDLKAKITSNAELDEKILALKVKLGVEASFDDKLALLNEKVDQLTLAIEKLVEAKTAELAKAVEVKKDSPKLTKEAVVVKKDSPKLTKEVAAVKQDSSKLTKEVAAVKKAPAKRATVKKARATTEATPAAKPTRTRRTTAKEKAAEVK